MSAAGRSWVVFFWSLMLYPNPIFPLVNELMLSKKSAKGNVAVVSAVAIALERGASVDETAMNELIYDGIGKIHKNGVVELRFPSSGVRSYSVAGKNARIRIKQAGAIFPFLSDPFVDTVAGVEITHVQAFPMVERVRSHIRRATARNPNKKWIIEPSKKIVLAPLDQYLMDVITSGARYALDHVLETYPKKVTANLTDGTVYLNLEYPTIYEITSFRFRGVIPKRDWLFRKAIKSSTRFSVRLVKGVPTVVKTIEKKPKGTMWIDSAVNEFVVGSNFHGDIPLAVGKTGAFMWGKRTGFVVYGMRDDDTRSGIRFRRTILRNPVSNEYYPIGTDGPAFFRALGRFLSGAHMMNLIHGNLRLAHVGAIDFKRMRPILKDFDRGVHLSVNVSPQEKALWMFLDVAGVIADWSGAEVKYGNLDNFTSDFLAGYFGSYLPRELRQECLSPEFARKLDSVSPGRRVDVPAQFPNLYMALVTKAIADGMDLTPDDQGPWSGFNSDYDPSQGLSDIFMSGGLGGWSDDFDSILSSIRKVKSAI